VRESLLQSCPSKTDLPRLLLLVGAGFFFIRLADFQSGLPKLALRFTLKNDLHLSPSGLAVFVMVSSCAWYLKPLVGILSDSVPICGTRRRHYLLGSAFVAALVWTLVALIPHGYFPLLAACTTLSIALVIFQTTLGGVLVEQGQRLRATGRLASQRSVAIGAASLIAGPFGGLLAGFSFSTVATICASISCVLALLFVAFFYEEPLSSEERDIQSRLLEEIRALYRSPPTLIALTLWCFVTFCPGFKTPLFYYQTDTLSFSAQFIGWLNFVSGGCALLGGLAYAWLCRKRPLRFLLVAGVVLHASHVALYFGYRSHFSAICIEGVAAFANVLAFLPILDLVARATPQKAAALGYALVFSLGNLSTTLSDIVGSWAWDSRGLNFMDLLWLNIGTTLLVFLLLPLVPAALTSSTDG